MRVIFCFLTLFCILCTTSCTYKDVKYQNCKNDFLCAEKIAGFHFLPEISIIKIKAKKGKIEITSLLNKTKNVTITKSDEEFFITKFLKEKLILDNGVEFLIKKENNIIKKAYLGAESGYFEIQSNDGLSKEEIQKIYEILAKAEAPVFPD